MRGPMNKTARVRASLLTGAMALALCASALFVPRARAGGFELAGAGTVPLGRGGAWSARADDSLALLYNPAMLADVGDPHVQASLHLAIWDACVTRPGTYRDAVGADFTERETIFAEGASDPWIGDAMPSVCNSGIPQLVPQITASVPIMPELAIGFGILAPNGVGSTRWGDGNGTVRTAAGRLAPTPVRYALTEQDLLLFHPSVGIGWRPADWIRIGLTLQWGIAIVRFVNYTNTGTSPTEDPFNDIRTELQVNDFFVPAGILSVHFVPHENLDIMIGGRVSDSIGGVADATGHLSLETRSFSTDPLGPPTPNRIDGVTLQAGQPFQVNLGIRYGHRTRTRTYGVDSMEAGLRHQVDDPMSSEVFDLELNVVYEHNAQVRDFVIGMPAGSSVMLDGAPLTVPQPLPIPHGWSDVISVRLGGDVNVVPGIFSLRGGVNFEEPFQTSRFQIQDFLSGRRLGLHLGATVRIDRFDISAAYAHVFQWSQTITDGQYRQVGASGTEGACAGASTYDPSMPVVDRGCYPNGFGPVVNNAEYTSEYNIFSLSAGYHFE